MTCVWWLKYLKIDFKIKKQEALRNTGKGQLHATRDQITSLMALLVYIGPVLYLLCTKKPSTP
jgi:hypothetical protein